MMPWPDRPMEWGDEPVEPPPPPSAGRSLRLGFSAVYDYLGAAIGASLVAFVAFYVAVAQILHGLSLLPLKETRVAGTFLLALTLLLAPLVLGPLTAGLYTLARAMFRRDDPHLRDIWNGARWNLRPALALGYAQTFIGTVLVGDILFLLARRGVVFKAAGVALAYAALFWAMMTVYHWPLLVERRAPLRETLRRALQLAAANPFYTLSFVLAGAVLLLVPAVAFFRAPAVLVPVSLFWGALFPALHTAAALELLRKYDAPNAAPGDAAGNL